MMLRRLLAFLFLTLVCGGCALRQVQVPQDAAPPAPTAVPETSAQIALREKLRAAPWIGRDNAAPTASGLGLVVCEPVAAPGTDKVTADLGAGGAAWLHLFTAGQGAFGKTPLWSALDRARFEMARPDLRLTLADAAPLSAILGVTHIAIGTIEGDGKKATLRYQLYALPSRKPVGKSIAASGTPGQIVAALPGMARTLAARLGVAAPVVPPAVGATADQLAALAPVRWAASLTSAQRADLLALAPREPLAALLLAARGEFPTQTQQDAALKTLLAQTDGNPLVLSAVGDADKVSLIPFALSLARTLGRFPANGLLLTSQVWLKRIQADSRGELDAAERLTRATPGTPDAWLTLAWTMMQVADRTRRGRFNGRMTAAEEAYVFAIYPRCVMAAERAVSLDPHMARAWARLAEDASFVGDAAKAQKALEAADALSDDKTLIYDWGLQMYQPKWFDDAARLTALAARAVADPNLSDRQTTTLIFQLQHADLKPQADALRTRFIANLRRRLTKNPNDGDAHWSLAAALQSQDDLTGATQEYREAARLLPGNPDVRYALAELLDARHLNGAAMTAYRDVIRLDPNHRRAHYDLGYALKEAGKLTEAEAELRTALRLNPYLGEAHYGLGHVYALRNRWSEAAGQYREAGRLLPYLYDAQGALCLALGHIGRYDECLAAGEAALRLNPDDNATLDNMADACLHKKQWEDVVRFSRAALKVQPNDAVAYANLAEAHEGQGQRAQAQAEWQKVIVLDGVGPIGQIARRHLTKRP